MGTGLKYVGHFRDLEVYRKQRVLARRIIELTELSTLYEEIGRMLGSMIQKANTFAGSDHLLGEDEFPYLETPVADN